MADSQVTLGDSLVADNHETDPVHHDEFMFARRAPNGKWYTYEQFFEHYGVRAFPSKGL